MTVLEKIDVPQDKPVIISFGGSLEMAIAVRVNKDGVGCITGPMNENSKTLRITEAGIEERAVTKQCLQEMSTVPK